MLQNAHTAYFIFNKSTIKICLSYLKYKLRFRIILGNFLSGFKNIFLLHIFDAFSVPRRWKQVKI